MRFGLGSRVAILVDGFPKGEPKSPFGRGPGRESPGRWVSRGRAEISLWSGLSGASPKCEARGQIKNALDLMGVQGESKVSSGRRRSEAAKLHGPFIKMGSRDVVASNPRRNAATPNHRAGVGSTHLVKIAIKRLRT